MGVERRIEETEKRRERERGRKNKHVLIFSLACLVYVDAYM